MNVEDRREKRNARLRVAADGDRRGRTEFTDGPFRSRYAHIKHLQLGLDADDTHCLFARDEQHHLQHVLLWFPIVRELLPESPTQRLREQLTRLTTFEHPHRLACRSIEDGRPFAPVVVVTDFAEAISLLDAVVQSGPLPPHELPFLLQPMADAIDEAHQAGIVANVILPNRMLFLRDSLRPMFAGLGTGWHRYAELKSVVARPQEIAVSRRVFEAPEERFIVDPEALRRADIYAFASVCAYALLGREWYVLADTPIELEQHLVAVAGEQVGRSIAAALSTDPATRPESVLDVLATPSGLTERISPPVSAGRHDDLHSVQPRFGITAAGAPPNSLHEARGAINLPPGRPAPLLSAPRVPPRFRSSRAHGVPLVNNIGMEFVYINPAEVAPSGFIMGSNITEPGRGEDEMMRQVVLTRGFGISVMPVTLQHWRRLMPLPPALLGTSYDPAHPVTHVSWRDALQFCQRLCELHGERRGTDPERHMLQFGHTSIPAPEFSLPTEAEWEFCCRAGTVTPFAFGAGLPLAMANHGGSVSDEDVRRGRVVGGVTRSGAYPANAWGLYDMHGNVWEWCVDIYAPYMSGEDHVIDPRGPEPAVDEEPRFRVARGGSYFNTPTACRSAYRGRFPVGHRDANLGFRVVWLT